MFDIVKLDFGFCVVGGYKGVESNKVCGIGCYFDWDDLLLFELDDLWLIKVVLWLIR